MTNRQNIVTDSPVGWLRLCATDSALTALGFVDSEPSAADRAEPTGVLAEATDQLDAYFAGELREFDLPLAAAGTSFQHRVWRALREIPYGATASYGEIARRLGLAAGGSRAVGLANGANPIAIVVPCHRVIGADGSLTGYAGGLDRKRFLLELEASRTTEGTLFEAALR